MAQWQLLNGQELQVEAADNNISPNPQNYPLKFYGLGTSTIDPNKETVFLTHGWRGFGEQEPYQSPDEAAITALADELYPYYQVLFLDWSSASIDPFRPAPGGAAGRIGPVAEKIAQELRVVEAPITLIGHSLGGLMTSVIGDDLNPEKLLDIVALDAAYPAREYDLNRLTLEPDDIKDLKDVSDNSIALVVSDGIFDQLTGLAGDTDYASSADSSFVIKYDSVGGAAEAHGAVQYVYEDLLQNIGYPSKLAIYQSYFIL